MISVQSLTVTAVHAYTVSALNLIMHCKPPVFCYICCTYLFIFADLIHNYQLIVYNMLDSICTCLFSSVSRKHSVYLITSYMYTQAITNLTIIHIMYVTTRLLLILLCLAKGLITICYCMLLATKLQVDIIDGLFFSILLLHF